MTYLTIKYFKLLKAELIRERNKKLRALKQIFGVVDGKA